MSGGPGPRPGRSDWRRARRSQLAGREQRMVDRVPDERLEGAGRLGLHPGPPRDRRRPWQARRRSHVRTYAGTSSASASRARCRSSASVRAPTLDRANPYAAPTSVSAGRGMAAAHDTRCVGSAFTPRRPWAAPQPSVCDGPSSRTRCA